MRILVIKGQSHYGGTRLFADEAAAAFGRRGDEVIILDLADKSPGPPLEEAAQANRFDLVLSFNILGNFRASNGRTMSELFGCPHVVRHTDYILASWDRLQETPSTTPLLVVDPTQIDALNAAAGFGRFSNVHFFPHPAVGASAPDDADPEAFAKARPIGVLWSGSFVKPRRPWSTAPAPTQKVLDRAVDLSLAVEWMPPHVALAKALRDVGVDVSKPEHRAGLALASMVDTEVRERRRHAFLMALAKSGVDLHICGSGWEPHLYRFKTATYHGAVEMAEMTALMRQTRVVLNTNGNFGAGSHERPFSASLAGAAVFSDLSQYYAAEFRIGENIDLFSWLDLAGAMDQLRELSRDTERCWRYACSAKQQTLAKHTWDRQIDDLLEVAGLQGAGATASSTLEPD